ncbi:hypothetical protein Tco_0032432 [Tanacetum coccineum]
MRTRSQSRNPNRQQQQVNPTFVEPFNLIEPIPVVTMDDTRTMAQLLEAPTVGYEDAIVVPEITADNFELKHGLLTLITSTMKFPNVPSTSVKLMLFPFSLEGAARIWLEKEPPRSESHMGIFQQRFDETFYEAWDRFNDLLRACPHHGFSELHQLDTFYNALNSNDQDSLNSAAGVVDFDADSRVPLILERSFLKTGRALIDVYEGELTLHVGKEAVTFNLDQTSRYSSNYDDMMANRIDVIKMACEEYSQEVLSFSDMIRDDFLLEEVDAFLALEDDPTSPEVDDSYYDPEGDILLLESFLNDDPSLPLPTPRNNFA